MFCSNCGKELNIGDNNCSNCGEKVTHNENNNDIQYQQKPKNKKGIIKKIIIGFVIFIAIIASIITIVSLTSKKLVCKSSEGNITIMYRDEKLTGYIVKNATYDLDKGNEYVKQMGISEYLKQFELWFTSNTTDGKCESK